MATTALDVLRATESPAAFAEHASGGWWKRTKHLDFINESLLDVAAGLCRYLLMELPPGCGKSEMTGRWFPSWFLGNFPDKTLAYVSHESDQASRFGRNVRNTLTEFGSLFGIEIQDDSSAANRWGIKDRRGGMYSVGIGGPLMGKRLDVLICDDPIKDHHKAFSELERNNLWEWLQSNGLRRREPGAATIMIMHRWHQDDLAARFKKQFGDLVRVITMPFEAKDNDQLGRKVGEVLWPERWSNEFAEIKAGTPDYWWNALYQQNPTGQGMAEWPPEYFEGDIWFDQWPTLDLKCLALDPSKGRGDKSDYSAYVLAGFDARGDLWIEADLQRRPVEKIVEDGIDLIQGWEPQIFSVETNSFQELLIGIFRDKCQRVQVTLPEVLYEANNTLNKEFRIRRIGPWLSQRLIHFRNTPGTRLLVQQLREFPLGAHDDGPDALEMAIRALGECGDIDIGPQHPVMLAPEYR